jgi:hypothetical protein
VTWEGPLSFSYGVDAFLGKLAPNKQPAGQRTFPERIERATLRFQARETIRQWFDRCAKIFDPEGLEYWRLEENLAAFAIVSWKAGNELEFATINVLKTECSLQDFLGLGDEDLKNEEWQDSREGLLRYRSLPLPVRPIIAQALTKLGEQQPVSFEHNGRAVIGLDLITGVTRPIGGKADLPRLHGNRPVAIPLSCWQDVTKIERVKHLMDESAKQVSSADFADFPVLPQTVELSSGGGIDGEDNRKKCLSKE